MNHYVCNRIDAVSRLPAGVISWGGDTASGTDDSGERMLWTSSLTSVGGGWAPEPWSEARALQMIAACDQVVDLTNIE